MRHQESRYRLGLVVGKFAPLHLGHEWLVSQAKSRCDSVLILSYSNPELPMCGPALRRRWLAARFPEHERHVIDGKWLQRVCRNRGIAVKAMPTNSASDAVQQEWLAWLLMLVLGKEPDAIFCSEEYGPSCANTLAQVFGKTVECVLVDPARRHLPISATAIRTAPALARQWTSPEVASSFVRRVALLGGESTGKTTLAAALAQRLETQWVPEYGRELWELQGGVSETDLLFIAQEQVRRENLAQLQSGPWLICDTSPLTTFGYSHWMFGRSDPELQKLSSRIYDAVVLCQPDFPFVQDGTRREEGFRLEQHAWYLSQLQDSKVPWLTVHGTVSERVEKVVNWLSKMPAR